MNSKTPVVAAKNNSIKWRQHEWWMVTAIALASLISRTWLICFVYAPEQFSTAFNETHTPFNIFRNILLPDISVGLFTYLTYLWFSFHIIPNLLFSNTQGHRSKILLLFSGTPFRGSAGTIFKHYKWVIVQVVLIIFILGCVFTAATYYRNLWQFNYPGFSIFFNPDNPRSQMDLAAKFFVATLGIVSYFFYLYVREFAIYRIAVSTQKEYNIAVCNKVTLFLAAFIPFHLLLQSFGIISDQHFLADYVLVIAGIFAMFISNVYWLFPGNDKVDFFSRKNLIPLLATSFVYAIPLSVLVHENGKAAIFYSWALQLFLVTPLTWLYYQFNKQRILRLRIVETALVKSNTNLQLLRSQINPHFLFNTLNTLYGTALQENAMRTAEGVQKLGDMMRFMLHENNLDFIQMDKEIAYLKNYISLQKLRTQLSPDITIEDNIDEQNCQHRIAPMLLIPLIENAFKHGISLKERSWIIIKLACDPKTIRFKVANSIHHKIGNDPERESPGIGIKNVQERLHLIYPNRHRIQAEKDEKEYRVLLSIEL